MDQRKLHKTVETIAQQKFATDEEMLKTVIDQIVYDQITGFTGGRIWKLYPDILGYRLLYQTGNMEKIDKNFVIRALEYPVFEQLAQSRTILGHETIEALRKKGIFSYSASGVGHRTKLQGKQFYEYVLALNSKNIDEELRVNLSIISTALTAQIKQRKISYSANQLKADIDKARQLQKSILPEHEYKFHHFDIYGITDPAEIVGGDFFDYLDIGDNNDRIGVTIGDAASKGVAAAAEAMYVSGALRMATTFEIKIYSIMKRMNELVNKIFEDDKFTSLFYGELSTYKNGLFLYANAGHNPPMFYQSKKNKFELLNATGPVLGPAPQSKYFVENINIYLNDILVLYSDGVTEAANSKFAFYGEQRVMTMIKKLKDKTPKEIALGILEDVIKFSANGSYTDDKTIVVIKRTS
ncbi:MAG: SpoIIE family protein phosphatase [Ignavibacteriaceae bacterium]|nr:SpoIIE family protein phosphatase [Ignavibacterium sp.]MCC6254425.1 SpoIIE family protein phosphatase [Ignavibacteriaceae bacterium]HMN24269.1 SpoIIE family protein phosphatase [Ignavibacteriaceae bacterium]HRN27300.1 SpoIIE family protein phosphatase [Ignavibacteriaceae bacterium]HRQ54713.1 SpoIIE family protein phosphatase [Ignavibacteriaceae bacterium]